MNKYLYAFTVAFLTLALSGCSTIMDGSSQTVRIETPSVEQGVCYLDRPGFRQRVWVPGSAHITKSEDPLHMTCFATGNRIVQISVPPEINDSAYYNVANVGLGAPFDYVTKAMFHYPDLIVVDFTHVEPKLMPKPDYDNLLREYPELASFEQFNPGKSILYSDRNKSYEAPAARKPYQDAFDNDDALVQQ